MPVEDRPAIIECAFYHAGPNGIETGVFLPPPLPAVEVAYPLSAEEQRRKQALIACFATQQKTLEYFPTTHESFRIAPAYDFTQPPHRPPVFYDGFPWGMRSLEFCELASKAERALDGSADDGSADKEFSGICR
jgi:N-acetylglucosamine malate deacetylase 2